MTRISEATTQIEAAGVPLDVRVRGPADEVLAGGPIEVEWALDNRGAASIYCAAGGSRAALRPMFFSFEASLDGDERPLEDPAAGVPDIGGPMSVLAIKPGAPLAQSLLVNEFVRLEQLVGRLADGQSGLLVLRCVRLLRLGDEEASALDRRAAAIQASLTLRIGVRRDDAAVSRLAQQLGDALRGEWNVRASSRHARPLAVLCAMRLPPAVPQLRMLSAHPDPSVRASVQRALDSSTEAPKN